MGEDSWKGEDPQLVGLITTHDLHMLNPTVNQASARSEEWRRLLIPGDDVANHCDKGYASGTFKYHGELWQEITFHSGM